MYVGKVNVGGKSAFNMDSTLSLVDQMKKSQQEKWHSPGSLHRLLNECVSLSLSAAVVSGCLCNSSSFDFDTVTLSEDLDFQL